MILLFPRWDMWSFPGGYFIPLTHLKTISRIEYPKWRTYIYQGASFSRWWQLKYCLSFHPDPWGRWSNLRSIFLRWLETASQFSGTLLSAKKLPTQRTPAARLWLVPRPFRWIRRSPEMVEKHLEKKNATKKWSNLEAMDLSFGIFGIFDPKYWNGIFGIFGMEYFKFGTECLEYYQFIPVVHWTDPKKRTKGF